MRVWAAHAVFAALLLGSLAAHERAPDPRVYGASLEPAVLRVAGSHGWGFLEHKANIVTDIVANESTLVFQVPGCAQPVLVSLRLWTFEDESIMQYAAQPGYTRRYIYYERTWDTPNPRAVFVQRLKYRALAMFGLTGYAPSDYLLLVEAPPHCQAAEVIDWRPVWNRDYRAAAEVGATAAGEEIVVA